MKIKEDVERFFTYQVYLQEGIVPIEKSGDMNKALDTMSPEQAIKMKRKFRKMWRKAVKSEFLQKEADPEFVKHWYGLDNGGRVPTRAQKNSRKQLVKSLVEEKVRDCVKSVTPKL